MSILNGPVQEVAPPLERVSKNLKTTAYNSFKQMITTYEDGLRKFWKNPRFTPQEISDELGNTAGELFRLHGLLYQTIKTANPETVITEVSSLGAFTINEDGTVTITRVGPLES